MFWQFLKSPSIKTQGFNLELETEELFKHICIDIYLLIAFIQEYISIIIQRKGCVCFFSLELKLSLKTGISFIQIIWHARTTCLVNFSVAFTNRVYTHFPEECKFFSLKWLLLLMSDITIALLGLIYQSNHKVIKKFIVGSDLIKSLLKTVSICEKSFIKSSFLPAQCWFYFSELELHKIVTKM